jgi:hypothetical protein
MLVCFTCSFWLSRLGYSLATRTECTSLGNPDDFDQQQHQQTRNCRPFLFGHWIPLQVRRAPRITLRSSSVPLILSLTARNWALPHQLESRTLLQRIRRVWTSRQNSISSIHSSDDFTCTQSSSPSLPVQVSSFSSHRECSSSPPK